MKIIIDEGNSVTKVAVFVKDNQECRLLYSSFTISDFLLLSKKYELRAGIYSTVKKNINTELVCRIREFIPSFLVFDESTKLPIKISYATPHTLGKDRIAVAVGAVEVSPRRNILIIDAGTAITYEMVEATGVFVGGNISPGLNTRFRALHDYTESLPLLKETADVPLIGSSTKEAIVAGVVNGIVYEMDGYIERLRAKYPDLLCFLTGGHSFYFEKRLKNPIFADINLVMKGLNRLIDYNVEN